MMFVQSLEGVSHHPAEDTKEEHLELAVAAFDRLAEKTMGRLADASRPESCAYQR
jgi:N-carbamoyl-L-amino-acid hydrolase